MLEMHHTETLKRLAVARDADRQPVGPRYEQAALLYARWRGYCDDPEYLRPAFKDRLDRMIGAMRADEWTHLPSVIPAFGETLFKDLLQYALDRVSAAQRARYRMRRMQDRERQ